MRLFAPLLVLLASAACVQPIDLCGDDSGCDPGHVCVMGRCRTPGEGASDAQVPGTAGGADGAAAGPDAPDPADAGSPDAGCDGGECWTPALLPGLALWLDAGFGVTGKVEGIVSRWQDRSGHGNDAVQNAVYLAPVPIPAGANGKPLVLFRSADSQGVHLRINDAPSLRWGHDPFTLLVVATSTNVQAAPGLVFHKRSPLTFDGLDIFAEGRGDGRLQLALRRGAVSYETIADRLTTGAPFLFAVRRRDSATLELRVNGRRDGRVIGSEVDVDVSAEGADVLLGAGADQTPACCQLYGGLAELIAVAGDLSDDDLGRVEAYLSAKYGLP